MASSAPGVEGTVEALFLKVAHGEPVRRVPHVTAVAGQGLTGDLSLGRPDRQVLLMEADALADMGLPPGAAKENITLGSLPLSNLPLGTLLRLGAALVTLEGVCEPCSFMDSLRPGLMAASRGRRGVFARVVTSGRISVGDVARVEVDPSA